MYQRLPRQESHQGGGPSVEMYISRKANACSLARGRAGSKAETASEEDGSPLAPHMARCRQMQPESWSVTVIQSVTMIGSFLSIRNAFRYISMPLSKLLNH